MDIVSEIKNNPEYKGHQNIFEVSNQEAGLWGFIAIHNTVLGPAVGGTRMYPYQSKKDAVIDVLRLSHAMTYKCALAGVNFGGGKGVIIGDPKTKKTAKLLQAYAEQINQLRGAFFTGEDVGITEDDVQIMLKFSPFFIGRKDKAKDPSPYAAISTFIAIKTASEKLFNLHSLLGRTVFVKGVGKVGSYLIDLLVEDGARVTIADIDKEAIKKIIDKWANVKVDAESNLYKQEYDIFSPCALGNELNEKTIPKLRVKLICGAANNQLKNDQAGKMLFEKGIIYVPDYIANAGGLINVVDELNPFGYNAARVKIQIQKIEGLVRQILARSKSSNLPTNQIADQMAEEVLKTQEKVKII